MANILTENQRRLLEAAGSIPFVSENFYLTGGTSLAEFYLGHRYSEDLDFFSEQEIDMLNLNAAITAIRNRVRATAIDLQQSYNRNLIFFHFGDEVVKTEFTFFPFPRIERGNVEFGVVIDSIIDIAVNKLFTIYQRVRARDFVDLYAIMRKEGFSMGDLVAKAKIKFDWQIDPLQLGAQFMKSQEAKDYPRMTAKISPQQWQEFFIEEAKRLKSEIIA